MTNKQFFIKTLEAERPIFTKVLKATPADQRDYKPHEKARTLSNLALQLAAQWSMITQITRDGVIDFGKPYVDENLPLDQAPALLDKNFDEMMQVINNCSDEDWENNESAMVWPGGEWKDKKYNMAWNMLFDAIHHRGQLSTYLRVMGAKVPGIYGGSADEPV